MKRLILIDGNSLMYRAYYGQGDPTKIKPNGKGIYTNAINNFARMIHNLLKEDYDYILVAFDKGKHTFRHEIMPEYKAGRSPMPDEFRMQIPYLKDFLRKSNIAQLELTDIEADDIVGSMAKIGEDEGLHVDIYSSDKDLLQLVSKNTTVHLNKTGMSELEDFTEEHFKEVYEIESSQFIDLKALMGDKSDNISGIPGIGIKKGIKLLKDFKDCEGILNHIDEIKGKDKEKFLENKDLLMTCKKMVTILRDANLGIGLSDISKKEPNNAELLELYEYLELNGLIKELKQKNNSFKEEEITYKYINDPSEIKKILVENSAIHFELDSDNYHKANLIGISLSNSKGNFIIDNSLLDYSLDFRMFLEDSENKKMVYDLKKTNVFLKRYNISFKADFDLLLASYVINPSVAKNEFKALLATYDYYDLSYDEEIYSKGAKWHLPEKDIYYNHLAKKALAIYKIKDKVLKIIKDNDQIHLLNDIEIPLSYVLADMEYNGVLVSQEEMDIQKEAL
jgi:DNA polymerase-1